MKKTTIAALTLASSLVSVSAQIVCDGVRYNGPNSGWRDSVEVDGKCYCDSNFDHDIEDVEPDGFNGLTIREICDRLGPPPAGNQIAYNDIQCGNGPANTAGDEAADCCPGRVDNGADSCLDKGPVWDRSDVLGEEGIVTMRKRNARNFGIDGNNGGANGQNVYLWRYNSNNINQRWVEIDRGGGFFSYVKEDTNFALDGGNGGADRQNVHLWTSNSSNRNQQWRKVSVGGGAYKLIKRNAQGFTIDGGGGGANRNNVKIFDSSVDSQNLEWIIEEQ